MGSETIRQVDIYRDAQVLVEFGGLEEVLLQYLEYLHYSGYDVHKIGTITELSSEDEVNLLKSFVGGLRSEFTSFSS